MLSRQKDDRRTTDECSLHSIKSSLELGDGIGLDGVSDNGGIPICVLVALHDYLVRTWRLRR